MYRVGELDQRIQLQRRTRTRDGAGGSSSSWAAYATVDALVRPMSGRERENAARVEATAGYLVVIRYRPDVVEGDRVYWEAQGRYLNISFAKIRRRAWALEIEAELGTKT